MRWLKLEFEGREVYGVPDGDEIQVTDLTWPEILAGQAPRPVARTPRQGARLRNPVGRPGKIVAIGLNYLDHCQETGTPPPDHPVVFTKFPTSVNDPYGEIVWSAGLTQEVDFEAELAVVIGRRARNVPASEALSYVAGYTGANDVSARDLQFADGQWVRGKSLDTFCPLGPAFVTADEIPDPQALAIRCLVNGQVMQDSNTSLMIFPVAELIAFCSQAFTLEPGDVILTGTPHGVGFAREPKVFLQDGDTVTVEIERIGRLVNRCRTEA